MTRGETHHTSRSGGHKLSAPAKYGSMRKGGLNVARHCHSPYQLAVGSAWHLVGASGGTDRTISDGGPVTGLERRDRAGQIDQRSTPFAGGADGQITTEGEVVRHSETPHLRGVGQGPSQQQRRASTHHSLPSTSRPSGGRMGLRMCNGFVRLTAPGCSSGYHTTLPGGHKVSVTDRSWVRPKSSIRLTVPLAGRMGGGQPRERNVLHASLEAIILNDGTSVPLPKEGNLVIVGPNGAGKSRMLRDIASLCGTPHSGVAVITALKLRKEGTVADLREWIEAHVSSDNHLNGDRRVYHPGPTVQGFLDALVAQWGGSDPNRFSGLAGAFVGLVDAGTRITLGNAVPSFDLGTAPAVLPLQRVFMRGDVEQMLSDRTKAAFGFGIFVDRLAGSVIRLRVGERPPLPAGEIPTSDYIEAIQRHPPLDEQGDGVRSFVGLMLHILATERFVTLVDEPEAFLHPPQAYHLGQMLALTPGQLVVATHSSDVVRGMLATGSATSVARLVRDGHLNHASLLSSDEVSQLWSDPLLRYSLALDGLFHELVIVCEGDADCRF